MKRFFSLLILLCLYTNVISQNTVIEPDWINSKIEEEKYAECCFYHKEKINYSSRENFYEKVKELKNILTLEIAKKIQTSVRSTNIQEIKQTSNNNKTDFQSNFSSSSKISTNVRTIGSNFKFEHWPSEPIKDVKSITAYIKIERKELLLTYEALVRNEITSLYGDLEQNLEYNSENLKEISDKLSTSITELDNDLSILTNIKLGENYSQFQNDYVEIKRKYNQLLNKIIGKDFENNYRKANTLLQKKECMKAYDILNRLSIINPTDERINADKKLSLHCMETDILARITAFENKNDFENAIRSIDSLCWFIPEQIKLTESRRTKLIADYFNQNFRLIENLLATNVSEAEKIHQNISFFGTEKYKNKYNRYNDVIQKKKKSQLKLKFENEIDHKQFRDASKTLVKISTENGGTKDISKEIRKMNTKLETKIYAYEKKELQYDRPHLYSIKFGLNFVSPPMPLQLVMDSSGYLTNISKKGIDFISPLYTFEIYRKFITNVKYTEKKHRDKSTAHLIGLRIGLLNNSSKSILKKPVDSLSNVLSKNDIGEVQLSGILYNFFHISHGIMIGPNQDLTKATFVYSSNIGIKMRLWAFDLNANVRYNSDYNTYNNFYFEAGLSLNFNFYKKFNAEDKREVLVRVNKWKNFEENGYDNKKRKYYQN